MTALAQFRGSISAADHLTALYFELRRSRNLGQRGRLDAANMDLLSLPRAAVVASISALDAYVHAVLYERIPVSLRANPVPDALCELMAGAIQIRNGGTFKDALPILIAQDSLAEIFIKVRVRTLSFMSYQAPEKIAAAYELIGNNNIFDSVSNLWQGPGTDAEDIKRNLAAYVKRRNQIAHEGDHEAHGQPRPMQPQYAQGCRDFVEGLVSRLNRVAYGL